MVELEWAYDKNGNYVRISDFTRLEKKELMPFYCPLCYKVNKEERKEVIAKKGEERAHHFAHKEDYQHTSESIEHLNAKMSLFTSLDEHLKNQGVFYAGINLKDDSNPQLTGNKKNILLINILKNVRAIKLEKYVDSKRKPDICLYDEDGKPIRAIEIVVSSAPDEKKLVDLKSIELIELKIEPPEWIKSKLNYEAEIKFEVNPNEIHNLSLPFCEEHTGDGKLCVNDDQERLHCFVRSDDKYRIFDFEKCKYKGQSDRRCPWINTSGNKCNRMLLETEEEYCERCQKLIVDEKKRKEELQKNEKLENERLELQKLEWERLKRERAEREKLEKERSENDITIQKAGFIPADRIKKTSDDYGTAKIKDLNLPPPVKKFYINSGIFALYPPQAAAVDVGLLEGKNIVAAIPTASGKTLLAEFVMLKSILNGGGKALYIVPLRALASEKYDRFKSFEAVKKSSGRGISTGIATGDFDSKDEWLGNFDIIVATSEKADSLLRNRTHWMEEITVVIADEIHLIDSPDRGPTLEIVLAKLTRMNPKLQMIALSATIGNANEIAKWLNAELVVSDWRPIDLKEGVFYGSAINFVNGQREIKEIHKDSTISLVADTLIEGGQCLVFESSRKNAEGLASRIGTAISELLSRQIKEKLKTMAQEVRETSEVDTARKLALCIENGSAFHHAGLISEQRKIIEGGFRAGTIKVIAATPTLAAGLNLPARRVIIKGYRRYDVNFGLEPIPVLEYKQMAGRAGRPGLDPYGESVLVAKTYDELEELMKHYVLADVEKIWSKLASENALRTHILSTIVTGFARSMDELLEFMGATFYSLQQEPWSLRAVIEKIIGFLKEKKMIIEKDGLFATRLGELVSRLYIDPLSASNILEGMEKIEEKGIQYTELTLLHLVCRTPDMRSLYLRSNDYDWLSDLVMEHHNEFIHIPAQFKVDYEWFLSEVKTACVMLDWINEKKEEDIVRKFGIGEGDIRALAETTLWLVHSMAELGAYQKRACARKACELEKRVEYGAGPELLDLIQIRGIGRVRARRLYDAGFRDMQALRAADQKVIEKIIGTKTAVKILKQIGTIPVAEAEEQEEQEEREEREEQRRLGDFR